MAYLTDFHLGTERFFITRIGVQVEEPANFVIDRPLGSGDYDFIHFTTPALAQAKDGVHQRRAGGCIIYAPSSPQWYRGVHSSFNHDWFHFAGRNARTFIAQYDLPLNTFFYPSLDHAITSIIHDIFIEAYRGLPHGGRLVELFCERLFIHLNRMQTDGKPALGNTRRAKLYEHFQKVRYLLHAEPQKKWTVTDLASELCLSRSRFSVLYKEFFGISPMEEIIDLRIKKAAWLRTSTSLTVAQISYELGFEDPSYFCRLFTQRMGISPGKYA